MLTTGKAVKVTLYLSDGAEHPRSSRLPQHSELPLSQRHRQHAWWSRAWPDSAPQPGGYEETALEDPFDYPAEDRLAAWWRAAVADRPTSRTPSSRVRKVLRRSRHPRRPGGHPDMTCARLDARKSAAMTMRGPVP